MDSEFRDSLEDISSREEDHGCDARNPPAAADDDEELVTNSAVNDRLREIEDQTLMTQEEEEKERRWNEEVETMNGDLKLNIERTRRWRAGIQHQRELLVSRFERLKRRQVARSQYYIARIRHEQQQNGGTPAS